MSKNGKKEVCCIHFECVYCKAHLLRWVPEVALKELEMKRLREEHLELHRLAEIGRSIKEVMELANE